MDRCLTEAAYGRGGLLWLAVEGGEVTAAGEGDSWSHGTPGCHKAGDEC